MRNYNGLFVRDLPDGTVQAVGYIFRFKGHGCFEPSGVIPDNLSDEQIDAHNHLLGQAMLDGMKKHGHGTLYIHDDGTVSDWPGTFKIKAYYVKKSFHNFAGRDGRRDVWFVLDGSVWHGVNIGDSQILHVRRTKERVKHSNRPLVSF